jgi:hypothetical protein
MASVFLSYARRDGRDLVLKLRDSLVHLHQVWLDTEAIGGGMSWSEELEKAIDGCEVVVALLSPGAMASPICRGEHLRALRCGKPVIPILCSAAVDRPIYLEAANYRDFSRPSDYDRQLALLLGDIERGPALPRGTELAFTRPEASRPPSVRHAVARDGLVQHLRALILRDDGKPEVPLTVLRGIGGSGKTAVAAMLARDSAVCDAFPDGVVWVPMAAGQPSSLALGSIARAFGSEPLRFEGEESAARWLRDLLVQRAALIILDDVTSARQVDPFLADSARASLLVTTRSGTLASELGGKELEIPPLLLEEGQLLLENWAGRSDPAFPHVVKRFHGLPLALKIAGAQLRSSKLSGEAWLARLPGLGALGTSLDARGDRDRDLQACFELSLQRLKPFERACFVQLGVFEPGSTIPVSALMRAWRSAAPACHPAELDSALRRLEEVALCEPESAGGIRIHDLLSEYALEQLGEERQAAHERLVGSYTDEGGQWADIADDGYIHDHLVYHLHCADPTLGIRRFLERENVPASRPWSSIRTPVEYGADLALCRRLGRTNHTIGLGDDIAISLAMASLRSLSVNASPELLVELVARGGWSFERALDVARNLSDAEARVDALLALGRKNPAREHELLQLASQGLVGIPHSRRRQRVEELAVRLQALGHGSEGARWVARLIGADAFSYYAKPALYTRLDSETARVIEEVLGDEASALSKLAEAAHQVLPGIVDRAYEAAVEVADSYDRAFAYAPLVGLLAGKRHAAVQAEICEFLTKHANWSLLDEVRSGLDSDALAPVAFGLLGEDYVRDFWVGLERIEPYLKGDVRQELLAQLMQRGYDGNNPAPFFLLAARLDPESRVEWMEEGLRRIAEVTDAYGRISAIAQLSRELDEKLLARACLVLKSGKREPMLERYISDALERLGARCTTAAHARAVVQVAMSLSPDHLVAGVAAVQTLLGRPALRKIAEHLRSKVSVAALHSDVRARAWLLAEAELLDDGAEFVNSVLDAAFSTGHLLGGQTLLAACRSPSRFIEPRLTEFLSWPHLALRSRLVAALARSVSSGLLGQLGDAIFRVGDEDALETSSQRMIALEASLEVVCRAGAGPLLRAVSSDLGGWPETAAEWARRAIGRDLAALGRFADAAECFGRVSKHGRLWNEVRADLVRYLPDHLRETLDPEPFQPTAAEGAAFCMRLRAELEAGAEDALTISLSEVERMRPVIPRLERRELEGFARWYERYSRRYPDGVRESAVVEALLLAAVGPNAPESLIAQALDQTARLDKPYRVELLARVSEHASGDRRELLVRKALEYTRHQDYRPDSDLCVAACLVSGGQRVELLSRAMAIASAQPEGILRIVAAHVVRLKADDARKVLLAGLDATEYLDRRRFASWLRAVEFLLLHVAAAGDLRKIADSIEGVARRWP